jgi:hypothetical protein
LHHFYPAYDFTIANYAARVLKKEELEKKRATKVVGGGSVAGIGWGVASVFSSKK